MNNNRDLMLYIDDEEQSLKYFKLMFGKDYDVITANGAEQAWPLIQEHGHRLALVVSDQRMPGRSGVEILTVLKERYPATVRLLTTAYSDLSSAIAAVNSGAIYAYITKPWKIDDLKVVVRQALQYHHLLCERDALMAVKLTVFQQLLLVDRTRGLGIAMASFTGQVRRPLAAASAWLQHRHDAFGVTETDVVDPRDLWAGVLSQSRWLTILAGSIGKWLSTERDSVSNADIAEVIFTAATGFITTKAADRAQAPQLIERKLLTAGFTELFRLLSALLPSEGVVTVQITISPNSPPLVLQINQRDESKPELDRLGLAAYLAIYHHGGLIKIPAWSTSERRVEIVFDNTQDDDMEAFLTQIAHSEP